MEGGCENRLDIKLYCDTLARVLGEHYGMKLECTPRPKGGNGGNTTKIDKNYQNS